MQNMDTAGGTRPSDLLIDDRGPRMREWQLEIWNGAGHRRSVRPHSQLAVSAAMEGLATTRRLDGLPVFGSWCRQWVFGDNQFGSLRSGRSVLEEQFAVRKGGGNG